MNYLAHAFLSNNQKELLVGNFIADHLRGNDFSAYPKEIVEGIYLHRSIDAYTDAHPEFKKSKRIFYDGFEKHSGILIDIYFDHFLAKNFANYHPQALADFSEQTYRVYQEHSHFLPSGSSRFLDYVIKNNIYYSYASLAGIQTVLYHLSNRIQHRVQLDESVGIFKRHEEELAQNFGVFFADVLKEFGLRA